MLVLESRKKNVAMMEKMGMYEGYNIPAFVFEKERKKAMEKTMELEEKRRRNKMEKKEVERIIREFITNDVTVSYFCALEGATLAIYPDEMAIGDSVTAEIKKDMPLAALKCPGCEYFNIDEVTDEVVHDIDAGIYLGDDGHVRELEDVIWEYMGKEDLEERKEQIVEELLEDWEDRQ